MLELEQKLESEALDFANTGDNGLNNHMAVELRKLAYWDGNPWGDSSDLGATTCNLHCA